MIFHSNRKHFNIALVTFFCMATSAGCATDRGESDEEVVTPGVTENTDNAGGTGNDGTGGSGAPAEGADIVINEFVASNVTGITDEAGGTGDWIELYNLSDEDIDLTGYFVSDDSQIPTKGLLQGLTIAAGSTLLLWADSDPEEGANHLPFNLNRDGEEIIVTSPMGFVLDSIDYQGAPSDASFARVPDGTGAFVICHTPTPEAPNDPTCGP